MSFETDSQDRDSGDRSRDASATGPGPRRAIVAMAPAAPGSPIRSRSIKRMSKNLPRRLELLSSRAKALRSAIRFDNFRPAQHLRMGLAAYLRHLEEPLPPI